MHPDGTAYGDTAVIIRNSIKHHEVDKSQQEHIEATSLVIQDRHGPFTITAIYSPPKHVIKENQFSQLFQSLGHRFIAGGYFNAKHPNWGLDLQHPEVENYINPRCP
ncbi:rna-directed dna polymerase from mobile element jockey-like protein [Lasius niger]|uniref:Rna-directed dna polymerase from mobile element jockey-like protein n=1 Tax=Lasius niger TaxID=67767 RepID=A0A0J7K1Z3_LASNI|nr:rna-directed dna polymerase from mobile element jockey-like protein [Lasius niger]